MGFELPKRKQIRLRGYDYSGSGAYFVTICSHNNKSIFGHIVAEEMVLNECGKSVFATWNDLPNHNCGIELDEFIVMPNHIHAIIIIVGAGSKPARQFDQIIVGAGSKPARQFDQIIVGAGSKPAHQYNRAGQGPAPTICDGVKLSEIVRQLKTYSAKRINQLRNTHGQPVWQRNFYEHIIRNEKSLNDIREYIINNPVKWKLDEYCG